MRRQLECCRYSKIVIGRNLEHFFSLRHKVLHPKGIEPLHRMRVASRRLRAALHFFKGILPHKNNKTWIEEVRKIGRALGLARELDVQIRFLNREKRKLSKAPFALNTQKIISLYKEKRSKVQKQINRVLRPNRIEKRLRGLKAYLEEPSCAMDEAGVKDCIEQERKLILRRLDTLLTFLPYVNKPERKKKLHKMRIAAKRLRYTLEISGPWHGVSFNKYIMACRDIQDALGDLHEFDLLAEELADFSGGNDSDFEKTITYLVDKCSVLRKDAYVRFLRIWRYTERKHLWAGLRNRV